MAVLAGRRNVSPFIFKAAQRLAIHHRNLRLQCRLSAHADVQLPHRRHERRMLQSGHTSIKTCAKISRQEPRLTAQPRELAHSRRTNSAASFSESVSASPKCCAPTSGHQAEELVVSREKRVRSSSTSVTARIATEATASSSTLPLKVMV